MKGRGGTGLTGRGRREGSRSRVSTRIARSSRRRAIEEMIEAVSMGVGSMVVGAFFRLAWKAILSKRGIDFPGRRSIVDGDIVNEMQCGMGEIRGMWIWVGKKRRRKEEKKKKREREEEEEKQKK